MARKARESRIGWIGRPISRETFKTVSLEKPVSLQGRRLELTSIGKAGPILKRTGAVGSEGQGHEAHSASSSFRALPCRGRPRGLFKGSVLLTKNNLTRSLSTTTVGLILLAGAALHTAAQQPARRYPSLPGAVDRPPSWLGKEAPFDLAAYFAAAPAGENAAPLYLDALFEFGSEMAECFPPGPETKARARKVRERLERLLPLGEAFDRDPGSVDRAMMAAVIATYEAGFQKLDQAQQRPRCVFENGLTFATHLPHVQASRYVALVASLRTLASLDRGDLSAPIADAARVLRMARDLQPRGGGIVLQIYAQEVEAVTKDVVTPVLSHVRLRDAHCDRLIKMLLDHEAHAVDGLSEALRADYLEERVTLYDLAGRPGDRDRAAADKARVAAFAAFREFNIPLPPSLRAMMADVPKATPQQFADAVADINAYYRHLFAAAKLPYDQKQAKAQSAGDVSSVTKSSAPVELIRVLRVEEQPFFGPGRLKLFQAHATTEANLHGLEALAAVRRWQITHRGADGGSLPPDLAEACREAGLKAVPIDPFSGQPMKFVVRDGRPIVYSVGVDGKDDGGNVDSKNPAQFGDLIYRLVRPH
jgi:hypothetical protein